MPFTKRRLAPAVSVTISSTLPSAAVDLTEISLTGVLVPALASSGDITIQVSAASSGTYTPLQLSDLSGAWTLTAGTTVAKSFFVPDLAPFPFAKVVIDTTQGSSATFTFIGRG